MAAPKLLLPLFRFFALLLAAFLATLAPLRADPPSFKGNGEPLHPSAVTTTLDGKAVPVVGVAGQKAQIEVDGKTADAPKDAAFGFVRMPAFAPGSVTVTNHEIKEVVKVTRSADGLPINELSDRDPTLEYHGTFMSDTTLPDAFVTLVIFDKGFLVGTTSTPSTAVFFKDLGPLERGKSREIVIELGKFSAAAKEKMQFFPLVYTGGREVRTQLSELSAAYFRKQEMTRHQSIVASYVSKNPDADKSLQPYVRVSPLLPPSAPNAVSTKVNARMTVSDDGTVNQVELQGNVPADIKVEVERALKAWLFLPQLVKGKPTVTKATVPLQIPLPPSASPAAK
jgi:hypothetical protein